MNDEDLILEIVYSNGTGELTVDMDHPAVAHFRRSAMLGKLTGKWTPVVIQTEDNSGRLFGTLVLTERERVLFFPGGNVTVTSPDPQSRFQDILLDHVTLDPPYDGVRSRSHLVARNLPAQRNHGLLKTTEPQPGHLISWFSLLCSDMSGFLEMPGKLRVRFTPPRPDAKYADHFMGSGGVAVFPAPIPKGQQSFFQFDLWVGRSINWKSSSTRPTAWVYVEGVAENTPRKRQDIQTSQVDIPLSESVGVRVMVSRPQGLLRNNRLFRLSH